MRPTCVLFDLDGTLIDHFGAIYRCHVYATRQLGLREPTMAQVRAAVGGGLEEAIAKLAGAEHVEALRPHFLAHWKATNLEDAKLLPGALEILTALRDAGIPRAVLTNKRGYAAREVCAHLGLTPLLDGIFGAEDTPWIKPHPSFTAYAFAQLKRDAIGAVLVGDSPFDVMTASQASLRFIGVTTGTHTAEQLKESGAETVFAGLAGIAGEFDL